MLEGIFMECAHHVLSWVSKRFLYFDLMTAKAENSASNGYVVRNSGKIKLKWYWIHKDEHK